MTDALSSPFRRAIAVLRGHGAGSPEIEEIIWALKDVSLAIKRGEVVGIIGRNGAGKSTLLKILARITEPTEGYGEICGRVGSLLEVGTGFHPELTGRENIYLNGAILGMKRAEIARKFDEIVAFSEVDRFIDTPVKHYSSGMYLRLAFAVAAHLEPDVLLVDEVLAVGDIGFQRKCLGKMEDVAKEGRTILFVSHNMGAIVRLCSRALWIDNGQLRLDDTSSTVVASYLSAGSTTQSTWYHPSAPSRDDNVQILSARLLTTDDQQHSMVHFDNGFKVEIAYEVQRQVRRLSILCRLTDMRGNILWTSWDTDTTNWRHTARRPGHYLSACKIPAGLLRPGHYLLSVGSVFGNVRTSEYYENVLAFDVSEVGFHLNVERAGILTPLLEWEVKQIDEVYDPISTEMD